jgi:2-polyprenyl-6-methoxyphenol hydroxylase-like FAD-dependent oxidoreductase
MVRFAEPISPVYSNRAMANRFRHYEQWQERLDGFIALGDAACAFNPVYGQGMTTGTISATILRDCLKQHGPTTPDLPRLFFRAQARFQQHPWGLATGADFRFPTTEGQRPQVSHLISPYMETLFQAGDNDPVIRHQVGHVLNLLKLPPALLAPHIVARVVWWALKRKLKGTGEVERPASAMPPVLASVG